MISTHYPCTRSRLCVALLSLLITTTSVSSATTPIDDLLQRIPGEANALVVVDVNKLLNSPLGLREGWKDKHASAFGKTPLIIPPGTRQMVLAALIDLNRMDTIWKVSAMTLTSPPTIETIAMTERGYVDIFADKKAAWSPIDAYFIELSSNTLGTVWPANRQFAVRWVQQKQTLSGVWTSYYLRTAAAVGAENSTCVVAVDLQDAASPLRIFRRLQENPVESLAHTNLDLKALAQFLAGSKGMVLHVHVTDKITADGELEFSTDAAILNDIGKPLLLEFLARNGMMISDLETWTFSVKDQRLLFAGNLSTVGLRQLLSLVNPPTPTLPAAPHATTQPNEKTQPQSDTVAASQAYFKAITATIEALAKQLGIGAQAKSLTAATTWVRRDAQRITNLPILNVDEELVVWGSDVSQRLTEVAQIFSLGSSTTLARKAALRADYYGNAAASSANYSYNYDNNGHSRDGGSGTIRLPSLEHQKQQAAMEEKAQAQAKAMEILKGLNAKRSAIRLQMTKKYGVEF